MIHFITGKPRGGKSLYGMRLIVDELVKGRRTVVTNLPINLPNLNEYLQKKYPASTVDIFRRIRTIDDEEAKQFFLCRGYDAHGEKVNIPDCPQDKPLDYSAGAVFGPVLYVIDEIHLMFNAREFAKTGKHALWYVSQHGKMGDDVICITQFVGNVDKQFRVLAQDFTAVRNLANERYGIFQLPGVFTRRTYQEVPTANSIACETGTFRLDVSGIASCYETAKGVGIHGAGDMGRRKSGFRFVWMLVALTVGAIALYNFPKVVGIFVKGALNNYMDSASASIGRTNRTDFNPTNSMPKLEQPGQSLPPSPIVQVAQVSTNNLQILGFTQYNGKQTMYLSDGRTVSGSYVKSIDRDKVTFNDGTVAIYSQSGKSIEKTAPAVDVSKNRANY